MAIAQQLREQCLKEAATNMLKEHESPIGGFTCRRTGAAVRDWTTRAAADGLAEARNSYNRAKSESALLVIHFPSLRVVTVMV